MLIVEPSAEILSLPSRPALLQLIETAGRTCYKSKSKLCPACCGSGYVGVFEPCPECNGDGSLTAVGFLDKITSSGHLSVIEHVSATVRIICDRGITHELVRHRLASFSQESTRYCNYTNDRFGSEITVIRPYFWCEDSAKYEVWKRAMEFAENSYIALIAAGASSQEARSVLPNSLKSEIVVTANMREWLLIFKQRTSKAAHPQMREVMLPLLAEFQRRVPVIFDSVRPAE